MSIITAAQPRVIHVEACMGTVFTIDIRDPGDWTGPIHAAVAWLHRMDAVFSTYRPDSDICRIGRGELAVAEADARVAEVIERCLQMQRATDGYFSPMWRGRLDPTGLVKGWAIEELSRQLRSAGSAHHAVNGGGDVQTAGEPSAGQPWQIGIVDPFNPTQLLAVTAGRGFAVATSGTAERGAHIVNPFTGASATELASVTVIGPEITVADCYATAACAMGTAALRWVDELSDEYDALVVTADGHRSDTAGFRRTR